MSTKCVRLFLLLVFCFSLAAQSPMNNEGVVKLVKSGMTEDLILNVIQQQPGSYSFGAEDLVALKDAGVSEKIIGAMLAKSNGQPASDAPGTAATGTGADRLRSSMSEPGIYYKKGNEYFELLPEIVEWRTSGALKNFVSAGIVKKDLKGDIPGTSSPNFLTNPMEILLRPPSGTNVNSFLLLPLKQEDGRRQFNVGPVNRKSGVAKGAIPFGVEKVGDDLYRVVLPTQLGPGEYGFLSAIPAQDSVTETGKMRTFRVLL